MSGHTLTVGHIERCASGSRFVISRCSCGELHTLHEGRPSRWISFEAEAGRLIARWHRDHVGSVE